MSRPRQLPLDERSIRDRAKNAGLPAARVVREISLNQLHRRLAFAGVEVLVKGGEALVARRLSTRATRDLDVRTNERDLDRALTSIRHALEADLGDGLLYRIESVVRDVSRQNTGGYAGMQLTLSVSLGVRQFDRFAIDLVVGKELTGTPTAAPSPLSLEMPELDPLTVLLYPSVDHIADKVCATHATYGSGNKPSSRVKDLYDLCVLRGAEDLDAALLYEAIAAESVARGLPVPKRIAVPVSMRARFEQLARREPHRRVPEAFDDAVQAVADFLDPVVGGPVPHGTWDPVTHRWVRA